MRTINTVNYLSVADVMERLGVTRSRLANWRSYNKERIAEDRLGPCHIKLGGEILYPEESFKQYLEREGI